MIKLTTLSLFFLAAGILTSVSILSAYQILFSIPLAYYTFLGIRKKNIKLSKSNWFLLAFILVALLSLIINYEYVPKPSKNFGRLRYFIYGLGGIFVLRIWLEKSSNFTKKFLSNTFLVSIIVAGLYATYAFFAFSQDRAKGLTDTLRYGYGSSMLLTILLASILHWRTLKGWFNLKLGIVAFAIGLLGMYLTYTRGALFSFITALPFTLYFFRRKIGLTLGALALAGSLTLVLLYLFGSGNYNSRFLVNKNNPSDYIRRSQWEAAIKATLEKPITGWGFSNFHSQLKRIKEQYDLGAKEYNDAHAHNLFLEISSGTGIPGLLLFTGWILMWAWEIWKTSGIVRALFFPFGIAWMIGSQFEMTLDANDASMIFFLYALSSCLTLKSVGKDSFGQN